MDLAASMGHVGDRDHPDVQKAPEAGMMEEVREPLAGYVYLPARETKKFKRGTRFY